MLTLTFDMRIRNCGNKIKVGATIIRIIKI